MTNFPKKITPNYARKSTKKISGTKVSKKTMDEMVAVIRKAKKIREAYLASNNAILFN